MQTKSLSLSKISRGFACALLLFVLTAMDASAARNLPGQQAKGLLFEIKSNSNTVYLFGSIHLAKANFYPLSTPIEKAYMQADTLAVEADITDNEATKRAMPLMSYATPDKLQSHLTLATWQNLQTIAGTAVEQFQGFKPAVVAMGLTLGAFAEQGYDPAYGIDLHFIEKAKADKKKIVELESIAFQASVLGGLSDEEGDALLKQTLEAFSSGEALRDAESMIAMWRAGDARGLAKIFQDAADKDAGSKKLMKQLLDDRNLGMTEKIKQMLSDGRKAFVVVGAGHLTGTNSIIELLQKQGVQVRQIP